MVMFTDLSPHADPARRHRQARPHGSGRRPRTRHGHARPLSARSFILVALAIVLAAGVIMLVISQASADEVASAFVPGAMSETAIGLAALGSLMVSCLVAGVLALSRGSLRPECDRTAHTGLGSLAS